MIVALHANGKQQENTHIVVIRYFFQEIANQQ